MIDIRTIQPGGHEALRDLFEAVPPGFATPLAPDDEGPRQFLLDPASFLLGAYISDTPVGLAWGVHMRSPSGRLTTYLHQLDVCEEWRRQGVGTALVSEAMDLGQREGSTKFWLSTGGHNEVAQSLYDFLGGDRKPLGDVNYWWDLGG